LQVRLRSLEAPSQFIVWNVVTALADSHGHASNRLPRAINADEDENNGVSHRNVRSEGVDLVANWVRQSADSMINLDRLKVTTYETANDLAPILHDAAKKICLSRHGLVMRKRSLAQSGFDSLATFGSIDLG